MRYIKIIKATFPKSNFAQNNQNQISEKMDFRKIIKAKFTENRFYQNNQSRIWGYFEKYDLELLSRNIVMLKLVFFICLA